MMLYVKQGGTIARADLAVKQGGTVTRHRQIRKTPWQPMLFDYEPIGGGGYVTGLTISPDGNTRMVRTDTGGAWRWDVTADEWRQMVTVTSMPDTYLSMASAEHGVQALITHNAVAYMAHRDAIFKSTDGGLHWVLNKTGIPTGANSNEQRSLNKHMVIDPANAATVLYGSRSSGVWFTLDAGSTWTLVPSGTVPFGSTTYGTVVEIDGSGNWYAGSNPNGVYRSTDHGSTWTQIATTPQIQTIGTIKAAPNGDVFIVGNTAANLDGQTTSVVLRYRSGTTTTILTGARPWRTIAIDPAGSGRLILQASDNYHRTSFDYGVTWSAQRQVTYASPSNDVPWLPAVLRSNGTGFLSSGAFEFDPVVANRVWMSSGIGVWQADLPASPSDLVPWQAHTRGIEQLVVNHVLTRPTGLPVASSWDRPIFLLGENPGGWPTHYHPHDGVFGSAWHSDYDAENPTRVVASIASHQYPSDPIDTGYSDDGGHTWTPFPTKPLSSTAGQDTFGFGTVHISGGTIIWVGSYSKGAYRTTDLGATWSKVTIPGVADSLLNSKPYYVLHHSAMTAEKAPGNAGVFYAHAAGGGFYRSTDGGVTWTQQATSAAFNYGAAVEWVWNGKLKADPGQAGRLFLTPGQLGDPGSYVTTAPFLRTVDGGVTWTQIPGLTMVTAFDFGKAGPGRTRLTLWAMGQSTAGFGLHRSLDSGDTWTLISLYPANLPTVVNSLGASKEVYGLLWLGTGGQGALHGQYA